MKKEGNNNSGDEVNEHQALFNLVNVLSVRVKEQQPLFKGQITESQGKLLLTFFNLFD